MVYDHDRGNAVQPAQKLFGPPLNRGYDHMAGLNDTDILQQCLLRTVYCNIRTILAGIQPGFGPSIALIDAEYCHDPLLGAVKSNASKS
jgi:hypothetical protein